MRFRRLAKAGFWNKQAKLFTDCPDFNGIMVDASHIKVHQHGMGTPGGTKGTGRPKGGINTKLHAAVDAQGVPVRFLITAGNQADCTQRTALLERSPLQYVLADKAYDIDTIIGYLLNRQAVPVIPPKINRKTQRDYDKRRSKNYSGEY